MIKLILFCNYGKFCVCDKGDFCFVGYTTVTWYESQVKVMRCCRLVRAYYPKLSGKQLFKKHKLKKFKLVKKMSNSECIH